MEGALTEGGCEEILTEGGCEGARTQKKEEKRKEKK